MDHDDIEITRALRAWFTPGDVFEIRILGAETGGYRKPHTESGYFTYETIDKVAPAMADFRAYRGAYATVNPCNPALHARSVDRFRSTQHNETTPDSEIVCRRWLLVDCDAVRPSGISSTEQEHSAALAKAEEIREGLASIDWPQPIVLDSGNGAQLMYRIDLPTNDSELVKSVLTELSKASSEQVNIDLVVYNPARIWRIPGTWNCKGDSTTDRPHRRAQIISLPDTLDVVSAETLAEIIEQPSGETAAPESRRRFDSDAKFNIDDWIRRFCSDVGPAIPWKTGRKWIFKVCPFNPEHTNSSAIITEQGSGAVGFTCHHNGCAGNDWHALRALRDPDGASRGYSSPCPNVDLSEFMAKVSSAVQNDNPEPLKQLFPDSGPVPSNLLRVPGFIDRLTSYTLSTAPYPNEPLAFSGALSLLSFLSGRIYRDKRGNHTNLYVVALADSGTGKDHPRKVNMRIAKEHGFLPSIGDSFASGEGLEDAMALMQAMLFQSDELDCIFNTLKQFDPRAESINERLLKFYGSSNSFYPLRRKARSRHDNGDNTHITYPHLALFGTAIPQYFYQALSRRVLENGLIARCLIVEAGPRGSAGLAASSPVPADLADVVVQLRRMSARDSVNPMTNTPSLATVGEDSDVTTHLAEIQARCDVTYSEYQKLKESSAMALWARAFV